MKRFLSALMLSTNLTGAVATVAIVPLMAACSTSTSTAPSVTQLASDANLIATGMSAVVTALQGTPGISAATLAQIQGYLTTLQADAKAVAASTAAPTSTIQEIATVVGELAPIALSFIPGGGALVAVVNAATSLLPGLLSAVGVAGATGKAPTYTPDQARLILRGAGK